TAVVASKASKLLLDAPALGGKQFTRPIRIHYGSLSPCCPVRGSAPVVEAHALGSRACALPRTGPGGGARGRACAHRGGGRDTQVVAVCMDGRGGARIVGDEEGRWGGESGSRLMRRQFEPAMPSIWRGR